MLLPIKPPLGYYVIMNTNISIYLKNWKWSVDRKLIHDCLALRSFHFAPTITIHSVPFKDSRDVDRVREHRMEQLTAFAQDLCLFSVDATDRLEKDIATVCYISVTYAVVHVTLLTPAYNYEQNDDDAWQQDCTRNNYGVNLCMRKVKLIHQTGRNILTHSVQESESFIIIVKC